MGKKLTYFIYVLWILIVLGPTLLFYFVSSLNQIGIMNPLGRDYRLTGSNVNIDIYGNGITNINEEINYKFKGCYREVFRKTDIYYPNKQYEDINEPYITYINAYCIPKCKVYDRNYEIAGNFNNICNQDAKFFINFTVNKGIILRKDISEFHYKIWGEQWDKPLERLKGGINLPSNINKNNINVFFNPLNIVNEYSIENNKITFTTDKFDNYLEVRILMPLETFNTFNQTQNFIFDSSLDKDSLIKIQEDYKKSFYSVKTFFIIFYFLLIALLIFFPIIIFKKCGKEPEIEYSGIYEREPIKGMKPYVINSLCMGRTGDTNKDAVPATLLDLIRRKHVLMEDIEIKDNILFFKKKINTFSLKFVENKNDELSNPEKLVYNFFKSYANSKNILIWNDFLKNLKNRTISLDYLSFTKKFEKSVDKDYDIKKYFDSEGNLIFKIFCACILVISFISLIIVSSSNSSNHTILKSFPILFITLTLYGIIGLFLSNRIFGRFSKEGYEIYQKTLNYKKFLTDMTLLKKYPPKSIVIWEEHLVYATLFGVASETIKNLKIVVKDSLVKSSNLYPIYNLSLISSISTPSSIASSYASRSGGFGGSFSGGVGGGFGGGGGGAR